MVVFAVVGGLGFSPTDEGLIQANAQRVLRGEIPHVDIISPRPLGSAYLHVVDLLLPAPLVLTSRLLALCQIAVYTVSLACLTFRRGPLRWSASQSLLVAIAILVNVHTFPFTAWHTIDGLFLVSTGFLVLALGFARKRGSLRDIAMVLIGSAALTKQSFAPALPLALLWIASDARPLGTRSVVLRCIRGTMVGVLPAAAYGLMLLAAGGLGEAWRQLTSGDTQVSDTIWLQLERTFDRLDPALIAGVIAILGLGVVQRIRSEHDLATLADFLARTTATIAVAAIIIGSELELGGTWGALLLLLALVAVVSGAIAGRGVDGIALLTAAIAMMAMLSWGYSVPNLVGGSLALLVIHRVWWTAPTPQWATDRVGYIGASCVCLAVLLVLGATFYEARTTQVYRYHANPELTVDLGSIDDDFAGIKGNEEIARYLRQIRSCLDEYPARNIAILPDNAMLSPVFDLDNPFPIDWMFLSEFADSRYQVVDAARRLSQRGDYLVLFETLPAFAAAQLLAPAEVPIDNGFYFYFDRVGEEIRASLAGTPVSRGSFVGVYSPPSQHSATGTYTRRLA